MQQQLGDVVRLAEVWDLSLVRLLRFSEDNSGGVGEIVGGEEQLDAVSVALGCDVGRDWVQPGFAQDLDLVDCDDLMEWFVGVREVVVEGLENLADCCQFVVVLRSWKCW